eukprot:TRINITY_DN1787_c0_g1_i3.p1 TRINITY_DN1787_c0_g1~~TRINITY_DN1787_c0_g1_i3.p1  ORF type:complete len:389 (+),score=68.91 TRINITY_DN1787_c0_g1_i3:73-1167(+)
MESDSEDQSSSDEFDEDVDSASDSLSSSHSPSKESSLSHQEEETIQTPSTEASQRHRRTPHSRTRSALRSRYFDGEVDLTCELCGQAGHASFNCPIFNRTCFLCGGRDHLQSSCPNEFCFNCLLPGHHARACRQQSARFVNCSRCGLRGHLAKNCPQRLFGVYPSQFKDAHCLWCEKRGHIDCSGKMSKSSSLKPKTSSCYLCGATGHSGRDCPSSFSFHGVMKTPYGMDRRGYDAPMATGTHHHVAPARKRQSPSPSPSPSQSRQRSASAPPSAKKDKEGVAKMKKMKKDSKGLRSQKNTRSEKSSFFSRKNRHDTKPSGVDHRHQQKKSHSSEKHEKGGGGRRGSRNPHTGRDGFGKRRKKS